MWINYQFMAVCPLILNFSHISSQKWLVFGNYFGLPNWPIFYTDISVISVTFSNSATGSGKSTIIKIIREIVNAILQQSGDPVESDCPRVLVCAPTGTAAINVRGK